MNLQNSKNYPHKIDNSKTPTGFRLHQVILVLLFVGTLIIATSLLWNIRQEKLNTLDSARIQARAIFDKDIAYRSWNAGHGGVYVPVTEETPPNPYLENLVPERDITTPSGKRLTLINPAYMTRQVHELASEAYDTKGHITSLKLIRPQNAPDGWEEEALKSFEVGKDEVSSIEMIDAIEHMRLMRPLFIEESCLKCHAQQGYVVGDVRGGISVSIPMAPYWIIAKRKFYSLSLAHLFIWLSGCAFLMVLFVKLRTKETERMKIEEEKKILKAEALRASQLASLGELAAGVAHEINNPINGIINYADLLKARDMSEETKDILGRITDEGERIADIVRSLLSFAREGSDEKEKVHISEVIAEALSLTGILLEKEGVTVNISIPRELPEVEITRRQITQVILNVLSNARYALNEKYSQTEGDKLVDIQAEETSLYDESFVRLTIKDNGTGIHVDIIDLIMNPFFTTKPQGKGTGLGLSISQNIINTQNGQFNIESKTGEYTKVIIDLPVSRKHDSQVQGL